MTWIKQGVTIAAGFLVGVVAGTCVATPIIAVLNYLATDGPIFPPPLVALGLLALPVGVILLPVQMAGSGYELIRHRSLGRGWLALAIVAGGGSGLAWFLVLRPSEYTLAQVALLAVFGVFQAFFALGTHLAARWLNFGAQAARSRT
jgi:hypothetical protein